MATLYVVGTPIGNLGDLTDRALAVLGSVDVVACEDTRHTAVLLGRYSIGTPTVSYHQHSTLTKIDWLVDQLKAGKNIALVTDAGTPGISDPGGVLVEKVHLYNRTAKEPISIISIPGPSSLTAALSISGFPADSFMFLGFLPKKKGRQSLMKALDGLDKALGVETIAFYESALRVQKTLIDIENFLVAKAPKLQVCLAREITKKFEEVWRGSLAEAIEKTKDEQRGEFVVILHFGK